MSAADKLRRAWPSIFRTGNRNAGGAQFFKWIRDNASGPTEFDEMNKLYCGVSGSIVSPGRAPIPVRVETLEGGSVCGNYHMCCWPCACDVEKYTRAEPLQLRVGGRTVERTVLTIPDPCAEPERMPAEVSTFRCEGGRTVNAVPATPGRIVVAMLHDVGRCVARDPKIDQRCEERKAVSACDLANQGGMAHIFAAVACAAAADAPACACDAPKK